MARHETQLTLDGYWHEEVRRSDPDARGNTTDIEYIYTRNRSDRGLELINDDSWWWLKRNSERVFNDAKAAQDRNTEVTLMWNGGSPRSSVGTPTRSPSAPPAPGRCGRCEPLSSTASPSSSGSAGQNLLEVFRRRCGDRNCCGGGRSNWCRPTGDRNRKERRAMAVICAGRFSEWPHGWEQSQRPTARRVGNDPWHRYRATATRAIRDVAGRTRYWRSRSQHASRTHRSVG